MTNNNPSSKASLTSSVQPALSTYDSGYEHSLEHLIEVRRRVAHAEQDAILASSAKAS